MTMDGLSMKRAGAMAIPLAIAAAAVVAAAPAPALASGLRIQGDSVSATDGSWDAFSATDKRAALDVSLSWTVVYLGKLFLLDVEGGYVHFAREESRLFGQYSTSVLGHGGYLGVRIQFRYDRDWLEVLQPFVRADFGWQWTRGAVQNAGEGTAVLSDWGNSGFIFASGGLQVTVPARFIRDKLKIRVSPRFSIGFSYEIGWYQPGPVKFKLSQEGGGDGGVEPIPVSGVYLGSLDTSGLVHRLGFVLSW